MIRSFADQESETLYNTGHSIKYRTFERIALRKLDMINAAIKVETLRIPPGNRLEALKGKRKGQYSIRINGQWRICFRWHDGNAWDVEIVDYH